MFLLDTPLASLARPVFAKVHFLWERFDAEGAFDGLGSSVFGISQYESGATRLNHRSRLFFDGSGAMVPSLGIRIAVRLF